LILLNSNELVSAGNTTDICVYKLRQGTLEDQYGKDSKQQQAKTKLRHVPPFPFWAPTAISDGLLLMLNSQGTSIDLWDSKAKTKVVSVVKKGDNLI
jgi:hypothetical protein